MRSLTMASNDFVKDNSQNFWIWNFLYIADFIVMAHLYFGIIGTIFLGLSPSKSVL